MRRIVHAVDESGAPDLSIWTYPLERSRADERAYTLNRAFSQTPGVSKILPANREQLLIIVADDFGYRRIRWSPVEGCPDPLAQE